MAAYAAVHTYTLGFCALETGRRASDVPPPAVDDSPEAGMIVGFVSERQFRAGLDALVAGLTAATAPAPH